MAQVNNNSSINISRIDFLTDPNKTVPLGNKLFNGYVYSMSLDVGFDGNPSSLVLNLALNKTLKQAKPTLSVQNQRKQDISFLNRSNAAKNTQSTPRSQISNQSQTFSGTSKTLSQLIDDDFFIEEQYIGATTSYNITIVDSKGKKTYTLKNFKISSYSLSKRNNEKILTVVLKDNAFVLDKIFVAVLGEQIALDGRSEINALVDKVILNCPSTFNVPAGAVTVSNFTQLLHFAESKLGVNLRSSLGQSADVIFDTTRGSNKSNYIIIKSKDPLKQIINGYGAVIILGEEDFKDSPCKGSEVYYSFKTLLIAMKALGIEISKVTDSSNLAGKGSSGSSGGLGSEPLDSLIDKSQGQIKRKYNGTLKNVLSQWCEDYSYSYAVDFSSQENKLVIKGIDLTDSVSKEAVLLTKLNLESLEASDNSDFVIKSQDFNFDLSKKNLKLYSSFYYKDARDKDLDFEQILGNRQIHNIKLDDVFPQLFSRGSNTYDFSGAKRTYSQVITSAILGKYAPNLREIYNYSIGAYEALGFLPLGGDKTTSRLTYLDNDNLIAFEAVSRALELQSELIFDEKGQLLINMNLGFYNESLATNILSIENFIADFIGKHYFTDVLNLQDGVAGNSDLLMQYSVETVPPTQKVFANELYKLPVFKEASFLLNSIASLFNGTESYFKAFAEFNQLRENVNNICDTAKAQYVNYINDLNKLKPVRFYQQRGDATYGIFKELIRGLEYFDYFLSPQGNQQGASTRLTRVNLSEAYSPTFKELSPVTLGVLQTALKVNVTNIPLANYSFGVLFGFTTPGQIYSFQSASGDVFTNPIEFQNSIGERCAIIRDLLTAGNINTVQSNLRACSKTFFYSICVQPREVELRNANASAQLNGLGPDPALCQRIQISRKMPNEAFVLAHVSRSLQSDGGMLSLVPPDPVTIYIQSAINPMPRQYRQTLGTLETQFIVMPSQQSYLISLRSKSSSKMHSPFKNFVRGGLESSEDINKILNNEGFSLEIDVNNITPNLRELFADETEQTYSNNQIINSQSGDGTPIVMNFKSYSLDSQPLYEFTTFEEFHKNIKKVYDSAASSLLQPAVSYSAELFCSSISESLKSLLSVNNGLSKLNINLVENGLIIQCSFESNPSKQINLQNLIYKNRPNIKLINTNFFN